MHIMYIYILYSHKISEKICYSTTLQLVLGRLGKCHHPHHPGW